MRSEEIRTVMDGVEYFIVTKPKAWPHVRAHCPFLTTDQVDAVRRMSSEPYWHKAFAPKEKP